MIARRVKVQLIAFIAVALLGISYVAFNYVGLDRLLLGSGYDVRAEFEDSGGIFSNAEVTYRGVAVGRVSDLALTEDGVSVGLTIDPDAPPIPADTRAVVTNRSAVGEQYVDLIPDTAGDPYLEDGSVIPVERTGIPVPVEQLLLNVDRLVGSIDTENLRTLVDELGTAFAGAGDDLTRLIDNGDLLLDRASESLPETISLIVDGRTVLDTQLAGRSAIQTWAEQLRLFTDQLRASDPDLRSLLVNAPAAGEAVSGLLDHAGTGLSSLFTNLDIVNQTVIPNLPGVEQILVTYPTIVAGGFTVVQRDPDGVVRAHFGLVLGSDTPSSCYTGYADTDTRRPGELGSSTTNTSAECLVYDGVDPNQGDGINETGTNIRGPQNLGSEVPSSGDGSGAGADPAPTDPGGANAGDVLTDILGTLPFAASGG